MEVLILGPIGVVESGAEMSLSPQLARLLGLLVVADGGYVSTDRIAEQRQIPMPAAVRLIFRPPPSLSSR